MDVAVEGEREILRVGFLNFNMDELYQKYYDSFDIVLVNDQTMTVPQQIFDHVHDSIHAISACHGWFIIIEIILYLFLEHGHPNAVIQQEEEAPKNETVQAVDETVKA